jgi:hypothetical protein
VGFVCAVGKWCGTLLAPSPPIRYDNHIYVDYSNLPHLCGAAQAEPGCDKGSNPSTIVHVAMNTSCAEDSPKCSYAGMFQVSDAVLDP